MKDKPTPSTAISSRNKTLKAKYQKLKNQLERQIKNGSFFSFSRQKQQHLLQRLHRYFQQLQRLAVPTILLSSALFLHPKVQAQTFTKVTDTNSPFIFIEGIDTDAPFGLSDVGNSNASFAAPTLVDIDQDGDLDAFIGSGSGHIFFFENTSNDNSTPAFTLVSTDNAFGLERVGNNSNAVFVDIDRDGDLDVFVGEGYGDINFFENTSTNSSIPTFTLSTSTSPFGLSVDFDYSVPTFIDIDGDGDQDAFVGVDGEDVKYFENTGTDSSIPAFSLSTSSQPFGLLSSLPFNVRRNTISFVDIDDDGDADAFIKVQNLSERKIYFYENTSTNTSLPAFSLISDSTPLGLNTSAPSYAPTFADIDQDGDLDCFVGDQYGTSNFLKNIGTKSLPSFQVPFIDVGRYSTPTLVDIDADGDLDLFSGKYISFAFYENIGNTSQPIFVLSESSQPFGLTPQDDNMTPTFVDIDQDGDLDAFWGENGGDFLYYENTSTDNSMPAFSPSGINPFGLTRRGAYSAPEFVDIDGDGDADVFSGIPFFDGPETFFFENTSTNSSIPAFDEINGITPFGLEGIFYLNFVDIDGDGDSDAFNGNFSSLSFFENVGSSTNPSFVKSTASMPFGLPDVGNNIYPVIVDLDSDGFFEAILGEENGNLNYFESDISTSLPQLEVTNFNTINNQFCRNTSRSFTEVNLGNRGCDRNGNAIYTASVTPANQGVTATVIGTGASACDFVIELNTSGSAVAGNYSVNLTIEDSDGVANSSNTPEILDTGTSIVFNLGIVEVLDLEEVEIEPIQDNTIDNGISEDIMVNISNTNASTTYEWTVDGVALPILTGDDVNTGTAIPIDLGNGNIINVAASTESVVGDFTQAILTIDNPVGGAAQDFEVRLTATQACGSATQTAVFTSGSFNCDDEDIILSNRNLPTDNYEALESITSESTILTSSVVSFIASQTIQLLPNFHAQNGSTFTAAIEDCTTNSIEDIEKRNTALSVTTSSLQLAPNPTSGTSQLQLYLETNQSLTVDIYDARGRLLMRAFDGALQAGQHQIELPVKDYADGVYFVVVKGLEDTWVAQLVVLE